ncbi:hypothetical protein LTS18_010107, partial [Coniosporium uncinatum]
VQCLVEAKVNLEARDREGRTPLIHLAAERAGEHLEQGVELLLRCGANIEAKDNAYRTALLWAAATGKERIARILLSGSFSPTANVHATNDRGRTALHFAAESGQEALAQLLLDSGAKVAATSDGEWTALHNAAEKGRVEIVNLLIRRRIDVNAETSSGMTALHWAAQNKHASVVEAIIAHPKARLNIKDSDDCTPMLRAAQRGHWPIVHMLSPYTDGTRLSSTARNACKGFEATIVDFGREKEQITAKKQVVFKNSVLDLLYGYDEPEKTGETEKKPHVHTLVQNLKGKPTFRWIHLPANNVAWAEALLTKHFIEDGCKDIESFKAVEKCFNQEHHGPNPHAHFMRHFCHKTMSEAEAAQRRGSQQMEARYFGTIPELPDTVAGATRDPPGAASDRSGRGQRVHGGNARLLPDNVPVANSGSPTRPRRLSEATDKSEVKVGKAGMGKNNRIVLFMPYLHYETDERRRKMRAAVQSAKDRRPPRANANADELLIHAYLNESPPLHIRRTLDQFYYHSIDTAERDQDQVVYRYCKNPERNLEPKVFFVDQLWLWIIGEGLVITCFPQRFEQPKKDPLNILEGIIEDVNAKTRPPVKSVYDLAMLITTRCSGIWDRHRIDTEEYEFLDMFEISIGDI